MSRAAAAIPLVSAPAPCAEPIVRLRGLTKHYGTRAALAGVDLTLDGRQIVGVIGPDGAGKTTLIRTLAGLLEIAATEATVLGHDLRGDVTTLKRSIGYVPQSFSLHRDLSIAENLRFTARIHRLPADEFATRRDVLLERTGLAPFRDRPAGALSGGMKQKLAVANALLARPPILLLDEPTAGVDVVARDDIWALLEGERDHALVVTSTSYLDEAARCDQLVYLDAGRVVASGPPATLPLAAHVEIYRAWGNDAHAIAEAAAILPYVTNVHPTGRCVRIEVAAHGRRSAADVVRDLEALAGLVHFAEALPLDLESRLVALARPGAAEPA